MSTPHDAWKAVQAFIDEVGPLPWKDVLDMLCFGLPSLDRVRRPVCAGVTYAVADLLVKDAIKRGDLEAFARGRSRRSPGILYLRPVCKSPRLVGKDGKDLLRFDRTCK